MLARVAICWHVPSLLCVAVCEGDLLVELYGEVGVARSEITGDDDDACDSPADVFSSLQLMFHVGGQVGQWCPCYMGWVVLVLARFSVN